MLNKTFILFKSTVEILTPPPDLKVSEWADSYRKLSPEASAEPGQWSTNRAPYQREPMDMISNSKVEKVVLMWGSQTGKTDSLILNSIGYYINLDPAPMMVLQPTDTMGNAFSKDRLSTMLRDTPVLKDKVKSAKSRDGDNTILHKSFPGGHITISGANSPASLASRPIRVLMADEIDRYPPSAGTEGDPLKLAIKRTDTFYNRKIIVTSTPTIEGQSRIQKEYESSSKAEWCKACPSCGEFQPLSWRQIVFPDNYKEAVTHVCKECGVLHTEIEWDSQEGKWIHQEPDNPIKGYHMNALASPFKGANWDNLVRDFKEAKDAAKRGDHTLLQVFINTVLAETWEDESIQIDEHELETRKEDYGADVPDGVLILTAGVDTQDDRLVCEVVGWGKGYESWGIEYQTFWGKPDKDDVWRRLDDYLKSSFFYEDGTSISISRVLIDSGGHCTTEVYKFCQPREVRGIYAIKGRFGSGLPIIYSVKKQKENNNVSLVHIGVDTGKERIMSSLQINKGEGYCHFPAAKEKGYDTFYFKGLTSEKKVKVLKRGTNVFEERWVKKTNRNEPLDCRNYALAAVEIYRPNFDILLKKREGLYDSGQVTAKKGRRVISRGIQY